MDTLQSFEERLTAPDFGVYVHVPFCFRRCPYCDFAIAIRSQIPHREYLNAVLHELRLRRPELVPRRADTLYFGGGTPSLWDLSCLRTVIGEVGQTFGRPAEITVEANPEELSDELVAGLVDAGVNRLSLGIQSFDDTVLRHLGRRHDQATAMAAAERALSAGFDKVSLDLIIGDVEQSHEAFCSDLERVVALGCQHVSVYGLTIEPATPFGRRQQRGEQLTVNDETMADRYEAAVSVLASAGLQQYEVSNYAAPGHWSRHNLCYWLGGEYLGLGMGAHSLRRTPGGGAIRRANGADIRRYLAMQPDFTEEVLPPSVHLAERLFLQFRTRVPLCLHRLEETWSTDQLDRYRPVLEELRAKGLLHQTDDGTWQSTVRALALHDSIAAAIVDRMPTEGG